MLIRIRCRDKPLDSQQAIESRGGSRHLTRNPKACDMDRKSELHIYADQSNYC